MQGQDKLTTYTFNTGKAKHTFCSICGVQSFYTPRSNPDGRGMMSIGLCSAVLTINLLPISNILSVNMD